jgi:glutathione S-transferase
VLSFCIINNIPVEIIETEIISGATESKPFISVSPAKTVPAITHNSLSLYESSAILIYLCSVFSVPDHWYPSDPELQGKVNVYLHWHHLNVRYGCGHYFYRKKVRPLFSNRGFSNDFEEEMLFVQRKSLELLEATLKNHDFVAATNEISIADLVCYCEVTHLRLLNFDFSIYPKLQAWINRVARIDGVRKAHQKFESYLASFKL